MSAISRALNKHCFAVSLRRDVVKRVMPHWGDASPYTPVRSRARTQYIDPHAQRHPEQTFSGLIWLKGLWIFAEKGGFLFCTTFRLLFLGGYRLQKCALDMGYWSQHVPIPYVMFENRVLLTSCLWNSSTVAVLFLCRGSEAFARRLAFSLPIFPRVFCLLPLRAGASRAIILWKKRAFMHEFKSSVIICTNADLSARLPVTYFL